MSKQQKIRLERTCSRCRGQALCSFQKRSTTFSTQLLGRTQESLTAFQLSKAGLENNCATMNPLPTSSYFHSSDEETLHHFRAILENSPQFIGLLSPDGVLLEINQPALEPQGLKREDVIGKPLWETIWWRDWPEAQEQLKRAVQQAREGESAHFTVRVTGNSREVVRVNIALHPIKNEAGEVIFLFPQSQDITDLHETIEQLRQSQQMLKQANHIAGLGYWTWDLRTDDVQISDELTRIFSEGSGAAITNYQQLIRYVHPEDRVAVRRSIQSALELKRNFVIPFRITRPDGAVRILRSMGQIVRDDDDQPVKVIGTVQDVTEIKSLETRLTESEKRYRYLVQELPDTGVVLYDPELIVFLVEGGGFLKKDLEDVDPIGMPVAEFLTLILGEQPDPEEIDFFKGVFEDQAQAYEQISGEICYSVHAVPLRNDDNEIYAGMAVIQDITQRVRVAERLSNLANQLKMLNHMGQVVVSNRNSHYIFAEVLSTVRELLAAEGAFIFLAENGQLLIEASDTENRADLIGQGMPANEGIAGDVWQSQKSLLLNGEECRLRLFKPLAEALGYTPLSFLAVPITWQDRKFGVFEAVHPQEGKFSQEDLKLLESASAWTAIALNNSTQHQQLERRLAESQVTTNLLEEILSASLTLQSVLQHVVEAGKNIIPSVDWAALHLLDEPNQQLRLEAITGIEVVAEEYTLHVGEGIAGRVLETGGLINVANVSQDERVASFPRSNHADSLIVAPIKNRLGTVIGTITLQSAKPDQFTAEDENLLRLLAHQAGLAIENARLYEQAEYGRHVAQVQRERLRQLTRQTVNAQEEERSRIARELHDEAGQSLTALKISLEILGNSLPDEMQAARQTVLEAAGQAGETLENLRSIAHNLRPPALDRLGLNLALAGLCEQFESMTEIQTKYTGMDLPLLHGTDEITLYRFVQEALTNIAKHAQATAVKVWMNTQTGLLEVHVQDDGKGMPANLLKFEDLEGMGLTSMEERLRIIDGKLDVQSAPGQGTHLCACVNLHLREEIL